MKGMFENQHISATPCTSYWRLSEQGLVLQCCTVLKLAAGLALATLLTSRPLEAAEPTAVSVSELASVDAQHSRRQVHRTIQEFTGNFRPVLHSELSAAQPGLVRQVLVEAGQQVRQGQLLVQLNDSVARQQQAAANAALMIAKAHSTEQQRLVTEALQIAKDAMLPATELHKRKAALQQAVAEQARAAALLAEADVVLAQHQINAPFDGVITERMAMPGNWLQPGEPLLAMVSLEKLWLDVEVPQQYYSQIARLQQADVTADMWPAKLLQLPLTARIPHGRADSRAFRIRLSYQQSAHTAILPGTSAQVRFTLATEQLTAVPQSALVSQPDGAWSVFTLPASAKAGDTVIASRQPVELVARHDGHVMVRGLQQQPLVLTTGHQQLKSQQLVQLAKVLPVQLSDDSAHTAGQQSVTQQAEEPQPESGV